MLDFGSFVALGDSFTEGVGDPAADGPGCRGWADRFAELLARQHSGLRYANLAVRGKLVREVLDEQVPAAVSMRPDLASLAAGGNDLLRSRSDPDVLAQTFENAVAALTAAGSAVMVFTGFDPKTFPVLRMIRGKTAVLSMHVRTIAARYDCLLADLWPMRVLTDRRLWSADRLHLNPDGHRLVALLAADAAGIPVPDGWRRPAPAARQPGAAGPAASWLMSRREDASWAADYAIPWLGRQIRGESTGDGRLPKRPELTPVVVPAGPAGDCASVKAALFAAADETPVGSRFAAADGTPVGSG